MTAMRTCVPARYVELRLVGVVDDPRTHRVAAGAQLDDSDAVGYEADHEPERERASARPDPTSQTVKQRYRSR